MDRKCVLAGAFVIQDASAPNGKCRKGSRISLDSLKEIKCREKSGASDGGESVTGYQTGVFNRQVLLIKTPTRSEPAFNLSGQ